MQIDRARFLLLTASLAGGGCSANPATDPQPPPAPTATDQEVVVPLAVASSTTSETMSTTSEEPDEPPPEPQPPPSGVCDNNIGTVPVCSISKPPGPHCESFSETKSSCRTFRTALRAGVAAKAVACLNAASGTQDICDFSKSESCASAAVRDACIQPSTFNQCSPVIAQCAGQSWSRLSLEDCQKLLSSVKDGKRKSMVTCMVEGCSIESCVWQLQ